MWWDERPEQWHNPQNANGSGTAMQLCPELHASVDLDDEYLRELVADGLRRRPQWKVTEEQGEGETITPAASLSQLHWGEYERFDWDRVHKGGQAASSYCVRKGLCRKSYLAYNLKKWGAKHPEGVIAKSVPETYLLSVDDVEYIDEALSDLPEVRDMEPGSAQWIAKPSIMNQGIGIAVIDSCAGLRTALEAQPDLREWVVQRYIADPLLVNNRKFHIRAYVLCIGRMKVYVWSEMLALFAGKPYSHDLSDLRAHLTNTCQQHIEGTANDLPTSAEEGSIVKLLSELPEALVSDGMQLRDAQMRMAEVTQKVNAIIGECMEAVSHELTFFPLADCFALFGFDLMVSRDWDVWLLEANADPDFSQTGERLKGLVSGLVEGTLQLVADPLAAVAVAAAQGNEQPGEQHAPDCQDNRDSTVGASRACSEHGQWTKVYETKAGGYSGSSGISMH